MQIHRKQKTIRQYQWVWPEAVCKHHPLSIRIIFIVIFPELSWTVDSETCSIHSGRSPGVGQRGSQRLVSTFSSVGLFKRYQNIIVLLSVYLEKASHEMLQPEKHRTNNKMEDGWLPFGCFSLWVLSVFLSGKVPR